MKLTTHGLKARDHQIDLDGLTLLVGGNGSGKSSIADAIRFLALGFVPNLGKRPLDTAVLMSDRELSVDLALPQGRSIRRILTRTEKGYQVGAEASWLSNAKSSEASKEITGLFGAEELDVAECLDIRQLLAATPNQRVARLEQLLSAGRRSPEETAAAVARLTVMRLIPNLPEDRMPADYLQALPMVAEGHTQVLREVGVMLNAKVQEAGITGALSWSNEEKRIAASGLNQKTQAEAELRLRAAEVPEPDEREIKRLEGERDGVQRQLGAVTSERQEYDRKRARRAVLENAIRNAQESAHVATESYNRVESLKANEIADLEAQRTALQKDLDALQAPAEPDRTRITDLLEEAESLETKTPKAPPVAPDTRDLELAVKDLERQIEQTKSSPWSEVLEIALELQFNHRLKKKGKRLEEIARAGLGSSIEGLEYERDRNQQALIEGRKAAEKIEVARVQYLRETKTIDERRRAISQEVRELEVTLNTRQAQALQGYREERQDLQYRIGAFDRDIEQHRQALQALRDQQTAADKRLASLQDELRGVGEIGEAPQDPAGIEQQLGYVREALDKMVHARAVHAEIQAVLSSIEAAKARREVYSAIEWSLQRQREIEISSAGGPLIKTMHEFFVAAGRLDQPFIRAAAGSCAIGWKRPGGEEINVAALSGGEFCVFAAALTSAVILCRRSILKILLVEAGETDDQHLDQILAGIRAVSHESLSMQAIVMVQRSPTVEPPGWHITVMTENAVAVR